MTHATRVINTSRSGSSATQQGAAGHVRMQNVLNFAWRGAALFEKIRKL